VRRLAAAALASAALGAGAAQEDARWYLQLDNDLFFNTDRWYSSGLRLARVAGAGDVQVEWGLLHEIYSPEGKYWSPGVDDRAPTARLLLYGARHRLTPALHETLELAAGVRGPAARGEQITDAVHKFADAAEVDWSRQEGDQVDIQLSAVRSHAFGDFHLHYGAVVGTEQVFAHGALEWRHGEGAARVALSPLLRYAATPPPPVSAPPGWAVFAGAGVRAIAHNAMIERNYDPLGPELDPRRVVGRAAAGFAWVGAWGSLTFALALDSREFDAQREPLPFGSLTLHLAF
jgi:lipid A 3-O-deacylase